MLRGGQHGANMRKAVGRSSFNSETGSVDAELTDLTEMVRGVYIFFLASKAQ